MKKIGIIWIALILLTVTALSSCAPRGNRIYDKRFELAKPNNLHDILLDRIDLTYEDLNLTSEEKAVLKKYSKYGNVFRAATYDWPGKSEAIEFEDNIYYLGVDNFEVEALAQILGINIEIEHMPMDDALVKLEAGQIDFIPGVYISHNVEGIAEISERGTITDFLYAYSYKDIEIEDITDLNGLRIGVISHMNVMNYQVEENLHRANVDYSLYTDYSSEFKALKALKENEIDVMIQTFSTDLIANRCELVNLSQIFPEDFSRILYTTKNEDMPVLMSIIQKVYDYNDYMKFIKHDYMNMYSAMTVSTGALFTEEENTYLESIKGAPLNVLAADDASPYITYDAFLDEWIGSSYMVWDAVTQVAGIDYNLVDAEKNAAEVYKDIVEGNEIGDISVIIPMYVTNDKLDYLLFSDPVVTDKFVVVGLHSTENLFEINELVNKRIGIVEGFDASQALKNYLPNERYLNSYSSNEELLIALEDGEIEYTVMSEGEFNEFFFIRRSYDIAVKYDITDVDSAIAFFDTEEGAMLQSIYNKVFPFIKSSQIVEGFYGVDTSINAVMRTRNRDMIVMFIFMFVIIIGFLAFFLLRMNRANKRVREIAFVNSVTGLQNRTAFYNENTLATGSLIYVDIDNFKRLNEVHGHDIGDMYAFEIAQRILSVAGDNGMQAYTMDIDSFLLLDDGSNSEDKLISIAAKILYEVTKTVRIYEVDHKLTASIGIAVKHDERGMEELFKKADTALFLAKDRGKNRYVIASEKEFIAHRKQQFLNEQLTQETIQNEIEPYYQPKVDIRDGRIIGVEALARWKSREQGMIYPDEIIPILKKNGTMPILDISILTKACKDYVEWLEERLIDKTFIVSCNMSYTTIEQHDIVAAIVQIHDNIGMPYRSLEIEIKEEDFVRHLPDMNDKLIQLAKMGVNISIDNFTADQSLMPQISKLPINVIKVDTTVMENGVTKKVRELLELISTLTQNLNLGLIIEGVETDEQIQILKEIPIYRVQGYYYGDAIDKEIIENNLKVKYIYR